MRKYVLLYLAFFCSVTLLAQEKIYIHKSDKTSTEVKISNIDSIYFSSDASKAYFRISGLLSEYAVSEIDSVSFIDYSNTIYVTYSGTTATVINPLASDGVTVIVSEADVTVNSISNDTDISYNLSGTSTNCSFKVYSTSKFNLKLDGVTLTNTDGPAINIQSNKKCNLTLVSGTTNTLTDGSSYASSTEDQKGTIFSEGQIDFDGNGSLTVKSNSAHAICSDDYIDIQAGIITVTGATKDGLHANDYFEMSGGTLNVTSTGDGVECESGYILISGGSLTSINNSANAKGLTCDSTLTVTGGTIKLTLAGNQSKGIKSDQKMALSGGTITINTSGGVVLASSGSGYDPAYCNAIKSDEDIEINGSNITITSTGAGGKGISATGNITITSGNVDISTSGTGATYKNTTGTTDTYFTTGIKSDNNITILGGTINIKNTGLAGKGISADNILTIGDTNNSPTITVKADGAGILLSGSGQNADYSIAKAMKATNALTINNGAITLTATGSSTGGFGGGEGIESFSLTINGGTINASVTDDCLNATKVGETMTGSDGSNLYINGGSINLNSSVGDAIDSNGNIVMSGGTAIVHGPSSAPEEGVDFNGTFKMTGGFFISSGSNSMMNQAMSSSSTQRNMYILSGSKISSGTLFHIEDASGNNITTFKPVRDYYSIVFSSSDLKAGASYKIYTGGSYTGGSSNNGLYTGGTYSTSGATLKKTATLSTSATVNTITF